MPLPIEPTALDLWFGALLTRMSGHRLFDLSVQSGTRHHVLGGLWFGAALFLLWTQAASGGDRGLRRRLVTILLGAALAAGISEAAVHLLTWPAPRNHPQLTQLYPPYLDPIETPNSFPSQSTALFAAVAAGVYSLRRREGALLWAVVALLVALPRIYIGGHYLSDAVAGAAFGAAAYLLVRYLLERPVVEPAVAYFEGRPRLLPLYHFLVFVGIWQVTTGFREAVWIKRAIPYFLN